MKFFVTLLLLTGIVSIGNAQITITEADVLNNTPSPSKISTSYSADANAVDGLNAIVAQSGADQTWDFSTVNYTQDAPGTPLLNFSLIPFTKNAAPLADDPDFSPSTTIEKFAYADSLLTEAYQFLVITPTEVSSCGVVVLDSTTPAQKYYSFVPPFLNQKFPMTYQSSWVGMSQEFGPSFDTTEGKTTTTRNEVIIDGFGKLILPNGGGTHDALRKRTTSLLISKRADGKIDTQTYYGYDWITKDNVSAFINVGTKPLSNAQAGGYSVTFTNAVHQNQSADISPIHLSSNPVSNKTTLTYTLPEAGVTNVVLIDALGQNVRHLSNAVANIGKNSLQIDANTLSNGTYFVQVTSGSFSAMQKFVVAK